MLCVGCVAVVAIVVTVVLSNCCRLLVVGFVVVAGAVVAPTAAVFALTCMCYCRCWILVTDAAVFAVAAFAVGVVRNS